MLKSGSHFESAHFLLLHRLMYPIRPPSTRHRSAGVLIDDDNLIVLNHIMHISLKEVMRFECRMNMMKKI